MVQFSAENVSTVKFDPKFLTISTSTNDIEKEINTVEDELKFYRERQSKLNCRNRSKLIKNKKSWRKYRGR